MEKHTHGKLRYMGIFHGDDGGKFHEIANDEGIAIIGEYGGPHTASDARRLVACWNACEGYQTEEIEKIAESKNGLRAFSIETVNALTAERDALLLEKAELVAHLKFAVKLLHGLPGISGTAQVEAMRDAITKHGGAK